MISYQKDPSAELLKSYLPPFKGTWKTLPSHLLPEDAVQDSFNVSLLGGKLRSRCGLKEYDRVSFRNKVLGSFLTVDTDRNKYPLASTKNTLYRYKQGAWENITGALVLNGTDNSQVRMSSIQLGVYVYVIYANGIDTLKIMSQGDYKLFNITPRVSTTIPVCTDICTSFSRFVGITPPYTVSWCDVINDSYLSFTSWPSLNQVILADTEDSLVAIRALGTLGLACYKEGNIFVGFAQSGPNSKAFRFEHRGEYEGPAGVNAIVNVNGTHMYMSPTGRVATFDGTQHTYINDGIWPFLQDDIDTVYSNRIFGVYNYKTAEVYFWYPGVGDNGLCKKMVIIDMPYPKAGVTDYSYFLGQSNFECTNGLSIRLFESVTSPLIFGSVQDTIFKTFILDKNTYTDDSRSFQCSFKPGLLRPPVVSSSGIPVDSDVYRSMLEVYATRDSTRGTVKVASHTSNLLENSGNASESETLDLTQQSVSEYVGFNDTGSFLGASFEWDSTSKFEYKGLDVLGRATL